MSSRRLSDKIFIDGTIKTVAEYSGFTEATMFQRFPSKKILLRDTFLYIDNKVSNILTQSSFIRDPDDTPFEIAIHSIWRMIYRYLIEHREETIFLIRYRYSSLYTDEVRHIAAASTMLMQCLRITLESLCILTRNFFELHFRNNAGFCGEGRYRIDRG